MGKLPLTVESGAKQGPLRPRIIGQAWGVWFPVHTARAWGFSLWAHWATARA